MNAGTIALLIGTFSTLVPFVGFYYMVKPKGKKWYIWFLYFFVASCASRLLNVILIDVMFK